MSVVTITSDWNKGDYYSGVLKGALLSSLSGISVVDITNSVPGFDVLQEIFILRATYPRFPQSTIHLMGVMSEPSPGNPMVIVCGEGHYFIGINDGRFSLLLDNPPPVCFEIITDGETLSASFASVDLFVRGVGIILSNSFESQTTICNLKRETAAGIVHDKNTITGRVIYCDSFGNAITNIPRTLFDSLHNGRNFTIFVQGPYTKIKKISRGYYDSFPGEPIALFNSLGLLELAVNQGDITKLENLTPSSQVKIKFDSEV